MADSIKQLEAKVSLLVMMLKRRRRLRKRMQSAETEAQRDAFRFDLMELNYKISQLEDSIEKGQD